MASFSDYRKMATDCARLAQHAPSGRGKQSFAAAARHWWALAQLSDGNGMARQGLAVGRGPQSRAKPSARDLGAIVDR